MTRRSLPALATLAALLVLAPAARADFGLVPGSVELAAVDAAGEPEIRAGAHPDRLRVAFELNTKPDGAADGNLKDVVIDLPTGFVGNPNAVPRCGRALFVQGSCPAQSQVGTIEATFPGLGTLPLEIYNVVPEPGDVAEFSFISTFVPVRLVGRLRAEGDYGTRMEIRNLSQELPLQAARIELWGVPADRQSAPGGLRRAFLTNPTRCDQGSSTGTLRVRSWQRPDDWLVAEPPGQPLTGCANLPFGPGFDFTPARTTADTPTGARMDLTLAQNDDPDGLATSQLRDAVVTLPDGFSLSPGVADGLSACGDAQLGVGTVHDPACPESSKIGTVELVSPVLSGVVHGEVYLGRPLPGDRYRLFLTGRGPGFALKLRGSLRPDPSTGRLAMVLTQLPELPFSRLTLTLKDGPRAPLATPPTCRAGTATANLTPHSGGDALATVLDPVTTGLGAAGAPCLAPAPFAPSLVAGVSPAAAGGDGAFTMTVRRRDGDRALGRLTLALPRGLIARLASAKRCPLAQARASACPASSRLGSVVIEAGAGPNPFELSGAAYLTGRQRTAPFGLALVVPAAVGPFDLGTLVVPATLGVDPLDAHLTIATEPLPRILGGIPLRLRTIGIDIDRPGFVVNPTACRPGGIATELRAVGEAAFRSTVRFAVRGCRKLRFAPRVSVALTGRPAGGRIRPGLRIRLRPAKGHANLRSADVDLPRSMRLDSSVLKTLCSRRQGRAGSCPRGSRVGSARARTPLLDAPLSGPVHVVQPRGDGLPELWAVLEGGGLRLVMRGLAARRDGHVRTTLTDLPDVPLASFSMKLRGGRRGLLSLSPRACGEGRPSVLRARTTLRAQNGKRRLGAIRLSAARPCGR